MEWSRLSIEVHNAEILIKPKLRLLKFERHSDELLYDNRGEEPQTLLTISRRHNLHHLHYCRTSRFSPQPRSITRLYCNEIKEWIPSYNNVLLPVPTRTSHRDVFNALLRKCKRTGRFNYKLELQNKLQSPGTTRRRNHSWTGSH